MKSKPAARKPASATALIGARISALGDWRGELLAGLRGIIRAADPAVIEEWKWDVPVWSAAGIICTGEIYKGKVRRAIDFAEGAKVDAAALTALVKAAIKLNRATAR